MKRFKLLLIIFMFTLLPLSTPGLDSVYSESPGETVRVMVEYRPASKAAVMRTALSENAEIHYEFDDLNVLTLTLPRAALEGIKHNPQVVSVEEDPRRYPVSVIQPAGTVDRMFQQSSNPYEVQVIPYGIDMVQARDVWDSDRDGVVDAGAPTGAGKTVCIIDSGLYTEHEDFFGVNVIGGYSSRSNRPWNEDGLGHGTHVAGTITAMNNEIGVVGVTPGTVNLYIVRVFDNNGNWIWGSTLIDSANRCASAGADIISMSLSGPSYSSLEDSAFQNLYDDGILSIAAASNEGTSAYHYPASYASVISVGALDSTMSWASFSNFNDQVELAAPGVDVLSTVPFIEVNTVTVDGSTFYGNHIVNTARGSVTGVLADGSLCEGTNPDWAGKVVLCERGTISFAEKVLNVQNSGGGAALIYNNVPGGFLGSIEPSTASIVGLSLSQEDGQYLAANKLELSTTVVSNEPTTGSGYEAWAGTSMATPHVSGVAALVWSCDPDATNGAVRGALTSTALDLGDPGRDDHYGYGLVQAFVACNALNPTAVDLLDFSAEMIREGIILQWETASEIDNLGFNLYRAESLDDERTKINPDLILVKTYPGSLTGATYSYVDTGADLDQGSLLPNQTYFYWLEDVDIYDSSKLHGPVAAEAFRAENPSENKLFFPVLFNP